MACLRARALSGRRQVAVVTGEAGIGKTWFCERVTADAERDGFDVVWGRCWPHAGAPALWPWPAVLADLIGASGASLLAEDPDAGERVAPERFARFVAVADRFKHACAGTPTMVVLDDLTQCRRRRPAAHPLPYRRFGPAPVGVATGLP